MDFAALVRRWGCNLDDVVRSSGLTKESELAEGTFAAYVLGPGTMLVTAAGSRPTADEEDPVLTAYLAFVETQMAAHPERLRPITKADRQAVDALVGQVDVNLEEELPEDFHLP